MLEEEAIARYRVIRRRQLRIVGLIGIAWIAFLAYVFVKPSWIALAPSTVFTLWAAVTAIGMLVTLLTCRCPSCGGFVGARFALTACPRCKIRFRAR